MPIFRVSIVEMFIAEEGDDTPRPFLEIRAFLFTDRIPEGFREQSIKNLLRGWIENVKMNFLAHIFESERNDIEPRSDSFMTSFNQMGKATFRSRIVIEGYEISELDENELIDRHFKQSRKGKRLILTNETPYLYVAFYKKNKGRPEEYDDADIKKAIGGTLQARMDRERLFRKAQGLAADIEQKTVQLHGAIGEMEKSLGKLKRY